MNSIKQWVKPTISKFQNSVIEGGSLTGFPEEVRTMTAGGCSTMTAFGTSPGCAPGTGCPCS